MLAVDARKLYRDVLRALRGVDEAVAADVRQTARERFAEHHNERDAERIRILLIDGQHSLDEMKSYLGMTARQRR